MRLSRPGADELHRALCPSIRQLRPVRRIAARAADKGRHQDGAG